MEETSENISRLNDIEYFYNVTLFNNSGDKIIILTQDAVKLLVIEDNVYDPFVSGYMLLDNPNNILQRKFEVDGEEQEAAYDFNLADTDYVFVEFVPRLSEDQKNKKDINQEFWNLTYTFAIYNIEEFEDDDPASNVKKVYLMDYNRFKLLDKTSKFSTANLQKDSEILPYLRDDTDRTEKTGNIIKAILNEGLDNPSFSTVWDEGFNEIFYTSPTNRTYLDDLYYIYQLHQGSVDSDFCILSKERYTEKWVLEKFQDIVSKSLKQSDKTKSGDYMMESFLISEIGEMPVIPLKSRVPTDYGLDKNVSFSDLSKLENFKLFEISRMDISKKIKTVIANSYNFNDGKFIIEHYDISDTKEYYDNNYLSKLKTNKSLFKLNSNQISNANVAYRYASQYDGDNTFEFISRNGVLKSQYLSNLAIEFQLIGMTHRQSGKFFSIRKDGNYYANEYEGKLQGVWFCTSVIHTFTRTNYNNTIAGIKLNLS